MQLPNQMPDEVVQEISDLIRGKGYLLTYVEMYYYKGMDKYQIQVGTPSSHFVLDNPD